MRYILLSYICVFNPDFVLKFTGPSLGKNMRSNNIDEKILYVCFNLRGTMRGVRCSKCLHKKMNRLLNR